MTGSQPFPPQVFRRNNYLISTDLGKIDLDMVHEFLANHSYWARDISRQTLKRSLDHSLCYGVYDCSEGVDKQIGFARVITDCARFAYLSDVFVLPRYRGQGLGKWLISCIFAHTELQEMSKWMLNTKDAHGFYERYGFRLNAEKDTYMVFQIKR